MGSSGCLVQAVIPAMASDAPMSFMNPRRETPSSHSEAPLGNSRCIISRNSSLPANSSRLRQNSGPLVSATTASAVARSSDFFLLGQTSSLCCIPSFSAIFISRFPTILSCADLFALAVARRATRNVCHSPQIVFLYQIGPQRKLVGIFFAVYRHGFRLRRLFVTHVEHLIARAKVFRGLAVTLQTPLHLQRRIVEHQRHAIDRSVARVATDSLINVNAVVKVDEVRKIVHSRPHQGFSTPVTLADRLQHGRTRPNLAVTIHAGCGGRDAGKARSLNRSMTVTAIDAEARHMVLVAERHRLGTRHF